VKSTNYEAPHYAVLSSLFLLSPFYVQSLLHVYKTETKLTDWPLILFVFVVLQASSWRGVQCK